MTWLTPYIEAWKSQFGGEPAMGPLAKALKKLEESHPPKEVLAHWRRYLAKAEPLFANPARFSQTYGSWKPKQTYKDLPNPNEEG